MRVILALLLGLAIPANSADAQPEPPDIAAFVQHIDALREQANIPGLSMAVLKNREIVLAAGLGLADIGQGIAATAETPYDIASVAKPISAAVALRLVEDGLVDLDKPIAEYSEWQDFCSRFSEQPSIFARDLRCQPPVHTIRHLLSHTAVGTPGSPVFIQPDPVLLGIAPDHGRHGCLLFRSRATVCLRACRNARFGTQVPRLAVARGPRCTGGTALPH